ncbi:MAG: AtpZ/AtpI family protein [Acidimicrobiia bacterium]
MENTSHKGELVRGWSASGDLFASLLAGLLIGLGLDAWFNTSPAFVVIFTVVAAIGAFLKIYAASSTIEDQAAEAIRGRDGL